MDLRPDCPPFAFFERRERPDKLEEKELEFIEFNIHKLNSRRKPEKKDRIIILGCFSEFGCETMGCMYCIPRIMKRFPGRYIIAMGWYGRKYLYQHLVDEFWEVKEEYMWLREYSRAFHHKSENLKKVEQAVGKHGMVFPSSMLGRFAVGNFCRTCGKYWHQWHMKNEQCPSCKSTVIVRSVFSDPEKYKKEVRPVPQPSPQCLEWAKNFVKPNTVAVFARGRKTYGRNLPPEFYVNLIKMLQGKGYNVVWLGEKQSTQACPLEGVIDFSRMPESRDLEKTLAIVCQCKFTVQFWTASSRLAGMMGVPFILFESPEQIYHSGMFPAQEGKRLELCSFGPRKVVISHYTPSVEDQEQTLMFAQKAVEEVEVGNYDEIVGMVEGDSLDWLHYWQDKMTGELYEDYYREAIENHKRTLKRVSIGIKKKPNSRPLLPIEAPIQVGGQVYHGYAMEDK